MTKADFFIMFVKIIMYLFFLSAVEAGIKIESKYIHMAFLSSSNFGSFCSIYSQKLISWRMQNHDLKQYLDT